MMNLSQSAYGWTRQMFYANFSVMNSPTFLYDETKVICLLISNKLSTPCQSMNSNNEQQLLQIFGLEDLVLKCLLF